MTKVFVEQPRLHPGLIITKYYILFQILFDTWFLCSNVQEPFVHLYSSYHLLNNLKSVTLPAIQYASTLFILFLHDYDSSPFSLSKSLSFAISCSCLLFLYIFAVCFGSGIQLPYIVALHCIRSQKRKKRNKYIFNRYFRISFLI